MRGRGLIAGIAGAAVLCAAGATAARSQEIGDPVKGRAFAREACGTCHGVEPGQRSTHAQAPSFETLAAIPGMSSTALYALLHTSHKTMPNLIIEADDQRNVISYILSLKQ